LLSQTLRHHRLKSWVTILWCDMQLMLLKEL
jgi:hypothetical protein